ncbi:hypothetical protein GBAR_LOCUS10873, partial [Geodia barretti]
MKSLQLVVVAVFAFSLMQTGASQCDVVRLAAAVHETLSPFMTEMRESLAAVKTEMKEDLSRIETKVHSLSGDIEEHKNKTAELSMTVTTAHSELERNVLTNVTNGLKKTADYILEHVYECGVVRLAAAVYETLSPLIAEMKQELASVKTELREGLAAVKENLTNLNMVKSLLISVNTSMSEGLSGVKTELQEHSSQTTSELAGLETNQETIDSKLDSLDSKQDGLSMTVTTAHSELERNVLTNVTKELKKTADYILELAHTYECG